MTKIRNTIKNIYPDGLCMGCGTCASACPRSAIRITKNAQDGLYMPIIDDNECDECGLCLKVCPGYSVDFINLNLRIFGKEPEHRWLGNHIGLYVGHATDYEIRYNSSSGGLVTALLVFALEEGIVDGVLVTRLSKNIPLEPEVFIARNKQEIISASGSKYCPVPVNVKLKDVFNADGKFAIVGLPCHIHGIRKFEMHDNGLMNKIVLHLGLMCSNNTTFLGTEYLLKQFGFRLEEIERFYYRKGGWLPKKKIVAVVGGVEKVVQIPPSGYELFRYRALDNGTFHNNFVIPRCLQCCDHTCELADISFGDPRLPELTKTANPGKSLILSRSQIGEDILRKVQLTDRVKLTKRLTIAQFFQSQNIKFKKKTSSRLYVLKLFRKPIPFYNTHKLSKPGPIDCLSILPYLPSYFSSQRSLWPLLYPCALIIFFLEILSLRLVASVRRLQNRDESS